MPRRQVAMVRIAAPVLEGAGVLLTGVLPWIVPAVRRLDGAMLGAGSNAVDQGMDTPPRTEIEETRVV